MADPTLITTGIGARAVLPAACETVLAADQLLQWPFQVLALRQVMPVCGPQTGCKFKNLYIVDSINVCNSFWAVG